MEQYKGLRFYTGIDVLDKMLGGQGNPLNNGMLFRGNPGSGKTTLCLQIARNHYFQSPDGTTAKGKVVFFSLENFADEVLSHMAESFRIDFKDEREHGAMKTIDRLELSEKIDALEDQLPTVIVKDLIQYDYAEEPVLVVIDSLNIFVDILVQCPVYRGRQVIDIREFFHLLIRQGKNRPKQLMFLFVGEHDRDCGRSDCYSESYFCDIDIVLTEEVIKRKQPIVFAPEFPNLTYKETFDINLTEKASFCVIQKSRNTPNQKRRCSYEIVSEKGIVFYETYPGEGTIRLFAENEPQLNVWKDIIETEITEAYMYPALKCNIFSRNSIQKTFSTLRRFSHIPTNTPMYLSSFDSYWINWSRELYQRGMIDNEIQAVHRDTGEPKAACKQHNILVGKLHRAYTAFLETHNADMALIESVCRQCRRCDNPEFRRHINDEQHATKLFNKLYRHETANSLFKCIREEDLRLFGETKSKVIHYEDAGVSKSCLLEKNYLFESMEDKQEKQFSAIPYNANISFMVYREDILEKLRNSYPERPDIRETYRQNIQSTYEAIENAWVCAGGRPRSYSCDVLAETEALAASFFNGERAKYRPQTWEEIIALCQVAQQVIEKTNTHILIETQTCSSFMCTILEFTWNCGGEIQVNPDYTIGKGSSVKEQRAQEEKLVGKLFRAYYLLYLLFSRGLTPWNCSVDPICVSKRYTPSSQEDWLFARHWYSTLVHLLTYKEQHSQGKEHFVWNNNNVMKCRLEIMPLPVSLDRYLEAKHCPDTANPLVHYSCWGEWYLGVLKGTENMALAVDLINNIMSSQKICDSAFSCASIPTVEDFYTHYGDAKCFNIVDRDEAILPKITYKDLKKTFMENGRVRSRTAIFDYRHSIRELHSVLEYVHNFKDFEPAELLAKIRSALERIKALSGHRMLNS